MKQGAYWTDPANQVVWGWVEGYHVGIGGWGEDMRVRVEARKEAGELVPERTCHKVRVHAAIEDEMHCSECGRFLGFAGYIGAPPYNYCPGCGAKVVSE